MDPYVTSGLTVEDRGPQVTVGVGEERLTVIPMAVNVMRVVINRGEPLKPPSLAVNTIPDPSVEVNVSGTASILTASTAAMALDIDMTDCSLTWRRPDGKSFLHLPRRRASRLERKEVWRTNFDPGSEVALRNTADGVRASAAGSAVLDRLAYEAVLDFDFADGEAIYGLGQHDDGVLNLRGSHQYLYQQNTKISSPVLASSRGWAVFADSGCAMTFHDDQHGSYLWMDTVDQLDFYVVAGTADGDYPELMRQLTRLSGAAPIPPKALFGYVQSKERYESAEELIGVADEFARRGIDLDVLVLDWKSWPEGLWGQKSLDPDRFPDPGALTRALHERGVKLMVSIWPIMAPGGDDQAELAASGGLLGNQANYNAFDPAARDLYWSQAYRGLFRHGIDYWWSDCTEPFEDDWKGPIRAQPELRFASNLAEFKKYLDPAQVNLYSLHHARGIHEGQRRAAPDQRVVNLTRSAFLGQQRYGTIAWSGDTSATWTALELQIAAALNFSLTAQPYWSCDVGAFFVKTDPELWFWRGDYPGGAEDLGYRELYVRWFQFGSFLPMLRAHGADTPREPWRFGEAGEPFYDAILGAITLRAQLLPYLYALAAEAHFEGQPLLRHLPYEFPRDPGSTDVRDQFLLGPSLLVAPVLRPHAYGPGSTKLHGVSHTRRVYLPAGTDWYALQDGTCQQGGVEIEVATPIDRIPVFVRAGSILPRLAPDGALELWVYPGADGEFWLYDDDGETNAYESGAYRRVRISYDDIGRRLRLDAPLGTGQVSDWLAAGREVRIVDPSGSVAVLADGSPANLPYSATELHVLLGSPAFPDRHH